MKIVTSYRNAGNKTLDRYEVIRIHLILCKLQCFATFYYYYDYNTMEYYLQHAKLSFLFILVLQTKFFFPNRDMLFLRYRPSNRPFYRSHHFAKLSINSNVLSIRFFGGRSSFLFSIQLLFLRSSQNQKHFNKVMRTHFSISISKAVRVQYQLLCTGISSF